MELQKIVHRAMDLRRQYAIKETELYGTPFTAVDIAQGFAGNANNLVKLIRAGRGEREIVKSRDQLPAQFAHCLWVVGVLAQRQKINLEAAFMEAMNRLEAHLLDTQRWHDTCIASDTPSGFEINIPYTMTIPSLELFGSNDKKHIPGHHRTRKE
jgi:NTP pyrophosphatase (non-canonical NTP hydrolase)